jgi:hypothetical protein
MDRIEQTEMLRGAQFRAEIAEAEAGSQMRSAETGAVIDGGVGHGMEIAWGAGRQAEQGGPEAGE